MDINKITILTSELEEAKNKLKQLQSARSQLNFGGHQNRAYAVVGDVKIEITTLERNTGWAAKLIRGQEMILLGMQKAFNARIDAQHERIAKIRDDISNEALKIARASVE